MICLIMFAMLLFWRRFKNCDGKQRLKTLHHTVPANIFIQYLHSSIQTPKRKTLLRTPGSQIRSRCAAHAEAASVCFPRAEMHCRAAFPQMVRVKANERVSLAQWKVGEAIATGLFFLLTGPMLLQYMFTLFWSKSLRSVQEWHLGRLS